MFLSSILEQTKRDLENLERYYQDAQAQQRVPSLSRPEQRAFRLEQAAYLDKMRRLAEFQPFAVLRETEAFLLAHQSEETNLEIIVEKGK